VRTAFCITAAFCLLSVSGCTGTLNLVGSPEEGASGGPSPQVFEPGVLAPGTEPDPLTEIPDDPVEACQRGVQQVALESTHRLGRDGYINRLGQHLPEQTVQHVRVLFGDVPSEHVSLEEELGAFDPSLATKDDAQRLMEEASNARWSMDQGTPRGQKAAGPRGASRVDACRKSQSCRAPSCAYR